MRDLQTITAKQLAERFHELKQKAWVKHVAGKYKYESIPWDKVDIGEQKLLIEAFQGILDELRQGWTVK